MKRPSRFIVALLLTVIYSAITLSPLAPLALRSAAIAHAVTGECSGDCAICGCSPERSATHSCCCWQKKLKKIEDDQKPECCKKRERDAAPKVTYSCPPCGSGKLFTLWGEEKFEQLPFYFSSVDLVFHEESNVMRQRSRLDDRYGEPPDPPPKITHLC